VNSTPTLLIAASLIGSAFLSTSGAQQITTETSKGTAAPANPAPGQIIQSAPANTSAGVLTTGNQDGVARARGKVVYIKNSKATTIDKELKIGDITAMPDGSVTLADGKKVQLEEGQMVTEKGQLITIGANPPGVVFTSGTTSTVGNPGRPQSINSPITQGKVDPKDPGNRNKDEKR
jgi:hypothetical protein